MYVSPTIIAEDSPHLARDACDAAGVTESAVGCCGPGCRVVNLRAEGGKSGMKLTLRLVLVPVSLAVAFLLAIWGERFTVAPLGHGRYEGTPVTEVEFFTVFPLVSIL